MTKKEMFNEIVTLATENNRMDIVKFAERELTLLARHNSTESKAQKAKQAEREALGAKAVTIISEAVEPMRTMEIATALNISPQKATPILKALVTEGKIKTVDSKKGVTLYSLTD